MAEKIQIDQADLKSTSTVVQKLLMSPPQPVTKEEHSFVASLVSRRASMTPATLAASSASASSPGATLSPDVSREGSRSVSPLSRTLGGVSPIRRAGRYFSAEAVSPIPAVDSGEVSPMGSSSPMPLSTFPSVKQREPSPPRASENSIFATPTMTLIVAEKAKKKMDSIMSLMVSDADADRVLDRELTEEEIYRTNSISVMWRLDVKERVFLAKRFISYAKYPSLDSALDQAAFRLVMKPFMLASALVDGMYRVHALWKGYSGVDFVIFCEIVTTVLKGEFEERAKMLFAMYDVNRDNSLSREELTHLLTMILETVEERIAGSQESKDRVQEFVSRLVDAQDSICTVEMFVRSVRRMPELSRRFAEFWGELMM